MLKHVIASNQRYLNENSQNENSQKEVPKPKIDEQQETNHLNMTKVCQLQRRSIYSGKSTPILRTYDSMKVFKAGDKSQAKSAEDLGEHLNFHGTFPFGKLGYNQNKLARAGSIKLK